MSTPQFPIKDMLAVVDNGDAFLKVLTDNPPSEWHRVLAVSSKSTLWTALCTIKRYDLLEPYMDLVAEDFKDRFNILEVDTLLDPQVRSIVLKMESQGQFSNVFFSKMLRSMINRTIWAQSDFTPLMDELLCIDPKEANGSKLSHVLISYNIKQNTAIQQNRAQDELEATRAQAQKLMDVLIKHGASTEQSVNFGHKPKGAIRSQIIKHPSVLDFIVFTMCKDGNKMGEHTLSLLLDQGADWRKVLNDPNVEEAGKQILRNQPLIRKTLLEEVLAHTPRQEGNTAKLKM